MEINFKCKSCGKIELVPELSKEQIADGEGYPDVCQDCPADPDIYLEMKCKVCGEKYKFFKNNNKIDICPSCYF